VPPAQRSEFGGSSRRRPEDDQGIGSPVTLPVADARAAALGVQFPFAHRVLQVLWDKTVHSESEFFSARNSFAAVQFPCPASVASSNPTSRDCAWVIGGRSEECVTAPPPLLPLLLLRPPCDCDSDCDSYE